ncbi:PRTRC system protein E [Schaalia cardiffensis]|nr:PRTRC system protein E [Schaalia cardiffensis]
MSQADARARGQAPRSQSAYSEGQVSQSQGGRSERQLAQSRVEYPPVAARLQVSESTVASPQMDMQAEGRASHSLRQAARAQGVHSEGQALQSQDARSQSTYSQEQAPHCEGARSQATPAHNARAQGARAVGARSEEQARGRADEIDFSTPLGASSDLTSTSLRALSSLADFSTSFVVGEEGVQRADTLSPIAASLSTSEPESVIGLDDAHSHHLLLLSDEVDQAEIEALALSIWDDARWEGAGRLRLTSGVLLEGPWRLDVAARKELRTPAVLTKVWVLRCPRSQRRPVPQWAIGVDEWAKVFPEGMPTGLEYRVLEAVKRMARRLGGALRIADSGQLIAPDPDSAVSLSVYSPRWLNAGELEALLSEEFPQIRDSRELAVRQAKATPAEEAALERALDAAGLTRAEIEMKILRAQKSVSPEVGGQDHLLEGYTLLTPIANRSDLAIEVCLVPTPPQVLRWESWTTGFVVEYSLRWLQAGSLQAPTRPSRTARLERIRSCHDIERAASLIARAVSGSVIDEDGFLVALDDALAD